MADQGRCTAYLLFLRICSAHLGIGWSKKLELLKPTNTKIFFDEIINDYAGKANLRKVYCKRSETAYFSEISQLQLGKIPHIVMYFKASQNKNAWLRYTQFPF